MKVKATLTSTREVEKELTLPYFAKEKYGTSFYRINEDETITSVYLVKNYKGRIIHAGFIIQDRADYIIKTIVESEPSNFDEFEEVSCEVLEYMDQKIKQFA